MATWVATMMEHSTVALSLRSAYRTAPRATMIATGVSMVCVIVYLFKDRSRGNEPPIYDDGIPFFGVVRRLGDQYDSIFQDATARFGKGEPFVLKVMGKRLVIIDNIGLTKKIWSRPDLMAMEPHELGGQLTALPAEWHRRLEHHRVAMKLEDPAKYLMSPQSLRGMREAMCASMKALPKSLVSSEWQEMDMTVMCDMLVWTLTGAALFGSKAWQSAMKDESLHARNLFKAYESAVPLFLSIPPIFQKILLGEAIAKRDELTEKYIMPMFKMIREDQEARQGASQTVRLYLDNVMSAHGSYSEAASTYAGFLIATNSNTGSSLFWALRACLMETDIKNQIIEEVTPHVENFFEDLSTYKDFNEAMPTLSSVIVELLRIGCPVSFRIAMKDCDITHNGRTYHFRKGDQILFQNQTEHNKENKYNQGKKWNPMAWTESIRGSSDIIGVPKEQSILTFGGGKHMCPGRALALMELKMIVAFVLVNFDVEADAGQLEKIKAKPELAVPMSKPIEDVKMKIRYRNKH